MPDLDALIGRLEAASGPDRELDEAIALLLLPELAELPRTEAGGLMHPRYGKIAPAERYTDSLDAAISLLPDGRCRIAVGVAYPEKNEGPVYWANCGKDVLDDKGSWIAANESEGATPAIALLIAILKARKAVA